jgi:predicted nucleic acid-binding protein
MIISNATPLIAFARIDQLPLLRKVVGTLVIPNAVAEEISDYTVSHHGIIHLAREAWISVQTVQSEAQVRLLLPTLDRGEAEVIALALERTPRLVLIDELTGRKVAESLHLTVSGSFGILIRAKQMGEITVVKPFLDEMIRRGVRYSQRFVTSVLQRLGEASLIASPSLLRCSAKAKSSITY